VDPVAKRARAGGGRCWPTWMRPPRRTAWPCPPALSAIPASAGSPWRRMGWLTRLGGLSIDNLGPPSGSPPTARCCGCSETQHPDLFWAIRGVGATSVWSRVFEFRCTRSVRWCTSVCCSGGWTRAPRCPGAREIIPTLPRTLNVLIRRAERAARPVHPRAAPAEPATPCWSPASVPRMNTPPPWPPSAPNSRRPSSFVTPMPFVACSSCSTRRTGGASTTTSARSYLAELTDEAIAVITDRGATQLAAVGVLFYRLDEAYCEVGEDDTAFSGERTPGVRGVHGGGLPDAGAADRRTGLGNRPLGTRCCRTRGHWLLCNGWPSTSRTGCSPPTVPSTPGWPSSRPVTTRATSSIATPTSSPADPG